MCKRAYDPDQSGIEQSAITELTATQLKSVTRYLGLLTNIDDNADVTHLPLILKIHSHKTCRPRLPINSSTICPSLTPPGFAP